MSVLLSVLLHYLNALTKVFGILEFSFDANSQTFIRSTFWQVYSWIWHLVFILPASCFGVYIFCTEVWRTVSSNRGSKYILNISIDNWAIGWAMGCIIIGISSVLMLRKRRMLQKVLNTLVSIEEMHKELFGEELNFYSTQFVNALLNAMLANWKFVPTNPWLSIYLVASWYHCLTYIVFTKVTLLFNQHYLESLARCLRKRRDCSSAKRTLYFLYYKKLLRLSKKLQTFWWPVLISTVILECLYILHIGVIEVLDNLFLTFVTAFFYIFNDSNMISLYKVTRRIHHLEMHTLNELFELELMLSDREWQSKRNLRLVRVSCLCYMKLPLNPLYTCVYRLQMEQLLLKRLTRQERVATLHNCFYLESTVLMQTADVIALISIIEFSLIYFVYKPTSAVTALPENT